MRGSMSKLVKSVGATAVPKAIGTGAVAGGEARCEVDARRAASRARVHPERDVAGEVADLGMARSCKEGRERKGRAPREGV